MIVRLAAHEIQTPPPGGRFPRKARDLRVAVDYQLPPSRPVEGFSTEAITNAMHRETPHGQEETHHLFMGTMYHFLNQMTTTDCLSFGNQPRKSVLKIRCVGFPSIISRYSLLGALIR